MVDRNNHIILEYRKKQVIKLYTAKQVFGYAGDKKSLDVVVNSKYGLSHIEWSAPALFAHGGKIEKEGQTGYSVILPQYQYGTASENIYVVTGVAVDNRGNSSSPVETSVNVTQAAIHLSTSSLSPNNSICITPKGSKRVMKGDLVISNNPKFYFL